MTRYDWVWPEDWPRPNYQDPETRGAPGFFMFLLAFTTVVVGLRLYSRCVLTRSFGLDDMFLVAGYVLSIGQTVIEYKALTVWGWNKHLWDVPLQNHPQARLAAWLVELLFILGTCCTKISILLVYRRISNAGNRPWFVRLTWFAIGFTAIYSLGFMLTLMLVCRPLNAYWKSYSVFYQENFTCGDERAPIVLNAAVSATSDIYASILPMLVVRQLRLTRRQRIGLNLLFSAGLLTAGTGIARSYYSWKVTTNYKPGPHTHDVTWSGWPVFAWSDVETHLAIICASVPALRLFFIKVVKQPLADVHVTSRSPRSPTPEQRKNPNTSWRTRSLTANSAGQSGWRTRFFTTNSGWRSRLFTNNTSWRTRSLTGISSPSSDDVLEKPTAVHFEVADGKRFGAQYTDKGNPFAAQYMDKGARRKEEV